MRTDEFRELDKARPGDPQETIQEWKSPPCPERPLTKQEAAAKEEREKKEAEKAWASHEKSMRVQNALREGARIGRPVSY